MLLLTLRSVQSNKITNHHSSKFQTNQDPCLIKSDNPCKIIEEELKRRYLLKTKVLKVSSKRLNASDKPPKTSDVDLRGTIMLV